MRSATCERTSDAEEEASDTLNVVVLYEDFTTAVRAMRLLARVCRDGGHRLPMNAEVWNFGVLGVEPLRSVALEAARTADLMVVAAHASDPLPAELKSWLDAWVASEHGEEVALIGLLDGIDDESAEHSSAHLVLESAAKRAGANLFSCNVGEPPPPSVNRLSRYPIGVQHWGINE